MEKTRKIGQIFPQATCISTQDLPVSPRVTFPSLSQITYELIPKPRHQSLLDEIAQKARSSQMILLGFDPTRRGEACAEWFETWLKGMGGRTVRLDTTTLRKEDLLKNLVKIQDTPKEAWPSASRGKAQSHWVQAVMDMTWRAEIGAWVRNREPDIINRPLTRMESSILGIIWHHKCRQQNYQSYSYWSAQFILKNHEKDIQVESSIVVPPFQPKFTEEDYTNLSNWETQSSEAKEEQELGLSLPQPEPGKPWRFPGKTEAQIYLNHIKKYPFFCAETTTIWEADDAWKPGLTTSEICQIAQDLQKGNRDEALKSLVTLYLRGHIGYPKTEDSNLSTQVYNELHLFAKSTNIQLETQRKETPSKIQKLSCLHPTNWFLTPETHSALEGNSQLDNWLYQEVYKRALDSQKRKEKTTHQKTYFNGPLPITAARLTKVSHVSKTNPIQNHMNVVLGSHVQNPNEKEISENQIFRAVNARLVKEESKPPANLDEEQLRNQIFQAGIGGQERTSFLLQELINMGLINARQIKGQREISLTKKGDTIANLLNEHFGQFLHGNYHRSISRALHMIEEGRQEPEQLLETWWNTVQEACEETLENGWDEGQSTKITEKSLKEEKNLFQAIG